MTSPDEKQLQETPDAAAGTMVRACDRCGTVCSTDQEWCLNCGVRMTEPSQRLPGLRAAGLVVSLAVLLAGGAAAASYAALRGDARSAANVPAETTGTPVAQAPATTAPVTPPVTDTVPTTASVPDTSSSSDTSALDTSSSDDTADDTSSSTADAGGTGAATPSTSTPSTSAGTGTGSGATGSGSTGSGSGSGSTNTGSGGTKDTDTTKDDDAKDDDAVPATGPVDFAAGQGTIYDPDGVVEDQGDEASAIDGSTSKSWKVKLFPEQTGGFGYVLDFDPATKLKNVNVVSGTKGATVKVLGTKRSTLPPDALDNGWDTLAGETTLQTGDNVIALKAVSGATSKYKHVLVLVTETPGTPAALTVREIKATR